MKTPPNQKNIKKDIPPSPIQIISPEIFDEEADEYTKQEIIKLANELKKTPELIEKTKYFKDMVMVPELILPDKRGKFDIKLFLLIAFFVLFFSLNYERIYYYFAFNIHLAIKYKTENQVMNLLTIDNIKELNHLGETIVFTAIRENKVNLVQHLQSLKLNFSHLSYNNDSCLHFVKSIEMAKILKMDHLLTQKNKFGYTPLMNLLEEVNDKTIPVIQYFVDHQKPSEEEILKCYESNRFLDLSICKYLVEKGEYSEFNMFRYSHDNDFLILFVPFHQIDENGRNILFYIHDLLQFRLFSKGINLDLKDNNGIGLLYYHTMLFCKKTHSFDIIKELFNSNYTFTKNEKRLFKELFGVKGHLDIIYNYIFSEKKCPLISSIPFQEIISNEQLFIITKDTEIQASNDVQIIYQQVKEIQKSLKVVHSKEKKDFLLKISPMLKFTQLKVE